jgi:hypothetical protein
MSKFSNLNLTGNENETKNLFDYRQNYTKNIMNVETYTYVADLLETHILYGKVDTNNKVIFPSEVGLKPLTNENLNNVLVQDFIADAFNDLKEYQKQYAFTSKFSNKDNLLFLLNPTKAQENVTTNYIEYITRYYSTFIKNFVTNSVKQKIKTFEDFVKTLLEFIDPLISSVPLNRSEYIKSRYNDPFTTGLYIKILNISNVADDRVKLNQAIQNPNFPIFVENAKRYGFFVDKYNPWRIIADLKSPPMIQYMNRYGIKDTNDLFNKRYYLAQNTDIVNLKEIMLGYYNSYVQENPVVQLKNYFNNCGTGYEIFGNKPVSKQFIEQKYGNEYFVRLYFYIKCRENNSKIDQEQFDRQVREAQNIYNYVGEETCINYINSKFPILSQKSDTSNLLTNEPDFDTIVRQSDNPNVFTPYRF